MKIQFDAKQQYQIDAVNSVVDIFEGQPLAALDFTTFMIEESLPLFRGQTRTELGMGNQLLLSADALKKNVRTVQERNDIEFEDAEADLESWPRYSATHRNPYNLAYRLDPIRAFELRLVKQIVVGSSVASGHMNDAFLRVEKIESKNGIKAKLRIHLQTAEGPTEKLVTIKKNGTDLYEISNNRASYRDGFVVTEISAEPGNELIRFNNGTVLQLGEEMGGMREDVWRVQIVNTVRKHLDKELEVRGKGRLRFRRMRCRRWLIAQKSKLMKGCWINIWQPLCHTTRGNWATIAFTNYARRIQTTIGLSKLAQRMRTSLNFKDEYGYGKYCSKLLQIGEHVEKERKKDLTPRQMDTFLLMIADNE